MHEERTGAVERERVKPGIWRRKNARGATVYEITFRDSDGRQRRQTVPGGMREAEAALARVKAGMADGKRVAPNPRLSFAEASEAWIEAKASGLSQRTVETYRYALRVHLLPRFGRARLDRIDVSTVARFVAEMSTPDYRRRVEAREGRSGTPETGYAVETIKTVLIPLSRTFAYAKRNLDFAGENPVAALDLDERPGYGQHKARKRKLGRDELDRLIGAAESPWREIIAFAACTGCRLGECLGVQWGDVDLDQGKVRIERQANRRRQLVRLKTPTAYRTLELPEWAVAMLRELKVRSPFSADGDLVFCTRTGRPHGHGNVLTRGIYASLERAGLERVTFHSLRHTHASLWIKDGGDVVTLSKRLGHSTPQVTMTTYAHDIEEANDDAARRARVDAMFGATQMAALMAAADRDRAPQAAVVVDADVVDLAEVRSESQQTAAA